ncbi:MAG: helix-turn-helix domain-containing protein [Candidatus Cloacimonadales bacterium]|jgi:transcriptional regulator with XRE-family HTH domain|nr:helix-turn-helix domain-containing protein [Candidatus Cloacimonadota bacterium]MDD2650306.1 helix-turn-helix domain-containing protein [Candidatus Cloacimonadota bacterium]MDX9976453.1 helix-turn-helix domain-containing protein [Candidatus Cloacimonadales bacterium]
MNSIGTYLKSLRESRQLTVNDLAKKSRMRPNIIEDIEADNLQELFESGHLKIFIISLGKFLEADQPSINKMLELVDKKFDIESINKVQLLEHVPAKKIIISSNAIYSILLSLFIIAITLVVIYFKKEGKLDIAQIRNELIAKKSIVIPKPKVENDIVKDTIWVKQQKALERKQTVDFKAENVIDNAKVFYDTTDYVSDIIFDNKYSDLNPEL